MHTEYRPSFWILRFDACFLFLAGGAAMLLETIGHFAGKGPLAQLHGSPYTIGSFEAHGLAVLIAVLLWRAAALADRRPWHWVGLSVHLLLGGANLLFWTTFVQQGLLVMGYLTTALHAALVFAHAACLAWPRRNSAIALS